MKKKKINKYLYGWKLYVNYGQGWEYEVFCPNRKEMIADRKDYRENCEYPIKISRGRESNPEFEKAEELRKIRERLQPSVFDTWK